MKELQKHRKNVCNNKFFIFLIINITVNLADDKMKRRV